ncbi:hypothetical protein [Pseudomonas chlororaphis]|uniref:hypothetical protein n=1 Tax=Pseudomonas chlororaphis TaxID=587753 RepID=UPI000D1145DA|nr:hypothetical protein [Pseudomonas chlororaphis]AVO60966.1 hypothetical protein C6Q18_24435 [Pseudomonas chlororaphis subsp. piscium]
MSASIIPFPDKSAGRQKMLTSSRQTLIAIDEMRNYRILGIDTMRNMSAAQGELIRLIRPYASGGEPPKAWELEAILRQYAGALRHMYFADEFLAERGQSVT